MVGKMSKMIEVRNLKKQFGDVVAVNDISFDVEAGELFGFLGENGAGKSTTINMMSTIYEPTEGTITICGRDVCKDAREVRRKIGVVSQGNMLDEKLTVRENLMIRGGLYEKEKRKLNERLQEVADLLELDDVMNRKYGMLSGGQKRRCEVAKALMNTPELLFLDEPTTGLDPATRKKLWDRLTTLRKETGMTIFLTTHYMEEAAKASHIAILEKGKIMEYGTPFELKERFARDTLLLVPTDREAVTAYLEQAGLTYRKKEEKICLNLRDTMEALPIVNALREQIGGFEVIQGSMDDVFLNATGKSLDGQDQQQNQEENSKKGKRR